MSLVRAADGTYPLVYGTLVEPDGDHPPPRPRTRSASRSPTRGRAPRPRPTYPAGWTIRLPGEDLDIRLPPTVAQQELDTRATTGVVYWEGSQVVTATRDGRPLGGEAYVELTGYLTADAP